MGHRNSDIDAELIKQELALVRHMANAEAEIAKRFVTASTTYFATLGADYDPVTYEPTYKLALRCPICYVSGVDNQAAIPFHVSAQTLYAQEPCDTGLACLWCRTPGVLVIHSSFQMRGPAGGFQIHGTLYMRKVVDE